MDGGRVVEISSPPPCLDHFLPTSPYFYHVFATPIISSPPHYTVLPHHFLTTSVITSSTVTSSQRLFHQLKHLITTSSLPSPPSQRHDHYLNRLITGLYHYLNYVITSSSSSSPQPPSQRHHYLNHVITRSSSTQPPNLG
ncbi:hypothetical protein Pcinc_034845 [Petrolisthes cinctipes]|uniref:Uncharacterized protein n=1 Tax=Petrolisthes cinctipes TaxID=88211 RepID=A0AAE1BXY5_PETCI|nr:hypothetical protein Pcinc_034845 [Petrolisthes cinctipes]